MTLSGASLRGFLGLGSVCLGLVFGGSAVGYPVDPTNPLRAIVGPPQGLAPQFRLNSSRTGRSPTLLPMRPRILWRSHVQGTVDGGLAVDPRGAVVVGSSLALSQVSRNGRVEWTHRLTTPAVGNVTLLADGTRVVATAEGLLLGISEWGTPRWQYHDGPPPRGVQTTLLPSADGGVVVAAGELVLWLDREGRRRAQETVSAPITALLGWRHRVLVVTRDGDILEWDGIQSPRHRAKAEGTNSGGAALIDPDLLALVVDGRRLVEVDLTLEVLRVRMADGPLEFNTPPVVAARQETRIVSTDGVLLGHDQAGRETLRTTLATAQSGSQPFSGQRAFGQAPLVVDANGNTAFALAFRDPGVRTSKGDVRVIPDVACSEPVALAPAGQLRLVGACRSGLIWVAGEQSAPS
ncbi:PQQ-binding-like beta-propeller repeat protein [Myxococcota bacterium]